MSRIKRRLISLLAAVFLLTTALGFVSMGFAYAAEDANGFTPLERVYAGQKYGAGSIYALRDGIGVRAIGDISSVSGAYFLGTVFETVQTDITVAEQAIVFDISVIGNGGSYSLRLGTDKFYAKGTPIYLYNGDTYVRTIQSSTDASYGLATLPGDGTYDKVVIPATAFGLTEGESYSIEKVSVLLRQGYQTANYARFVLHSVYMTDEYTAEAATLNITSAQTLYTPSESNFSLYAQNSSKYAPADYIDARYMKAGDLLFDDAEDLKGGKGAQLDKIYFAPKEGGSAKLLEEYDGFYYTVTNPDPETNYNFLWGLSDGTTTYWSNVNAAAKRILPSGQTADVTARYMHMGVEDALYYVPFTAFGGGLSELPASTDFENRLLMQVYSSNASSNANPKLAENGGVMMKLGQIAFVKDGTVRTVNTSGSVSASRVSGMDGMQITFQAQKTVNTARLNGEILGTDAMALLNGEGYSAMIDGADLSLSAGDYTVSVNSPENGTALISNDLYSEGESVVLTVKPNTGYMLKSVSVNGEDRTQEVGKYFNNKMILTEKEDLSITADFEKATEYAYERGTISSLWGVPEGSVFTEFDAVNVRTVKTFAEDDGAAYVGINVPVDSTKVGEFISIRVQSIAANNRYFYVELVGGDSVYRREKNAVYYYARIDGTAGSDKSYDQAYEAGEIKGTRIALAARQCVYENATLDVETNLKSNTQGFDGYMIIPMADFGTEQFDSINIYCASYATSYSRFNIGEIYSCSIGAEGLPVFEERLWSPEQEYSLYADTASFAEVQLLQKGDFIMANRGNRGESSYVYDEMFFTFPENAIGEDGYVDLASTGIKGIAITVKTERATRLILRVSGSENDGTYQSGDEVKKTSNLLKNDHTGVDLWQTSGSTHPSLVKLDTGLVKQSSSYLMPYYENYDGYYTIYIEFGDTAFSNWNGKLHFPEKLHPVMLLLGEDTLADGETARMNFQSIRFITDDSEFDTRTISLTPLNGVINGQIGNESVMASSNNRVIPGTSVTFSVTPNRGYELKELWYIDGDDEVDIPLSELNEDGTFNIVVNNDINVYCECKAIEYSIEYRADGGTVDKNNPNTYKVTDHITLSGAEKEGYEFIGWFDENGNQVTELKNHVGNMVLAARYEKKIPVGAIVGGIIGGVAVIGGCIIAFMIVRGKRKCKNQ